MRKVYLRKARVQDVRVEEEIIKTGGHFQAQLFKIPITATSGWSDHDITFPHSINILAAKWFDRSVNIGDKGQFIVAPDKVIGTITADIAVDDDELSVSQTVIDNIAIGYYVKIGSEEFGRVIAVDVPGSKITVENAATSTHSSGALVKISVRLMQIMYFDNLGQVEVGSSKIGASYVPANIVIRLRYQNNDAAAKNLYFVLEYLY